jgi:Ca-activated chloride channel family protein
VLLPLVARRYCPPGVRPKADIVLVLDASSSMAGPKLEAAVSAALSFVGLLDLPRDHAAIIAFDSEAHLASGLTGSRAALRVALAQTGTAIGTRIDLGLDAALAELSGPRARADAVPVIVLLTDGRPEGGTEDLVRAAAGRARLADVAVFTIGLGADVDGELLSDVATDPSRYYYAPGAADLESIYNRIAAGIPCR